MSPKLKPANAKARALLEKLQTLADRGVDGERLSAQQKIARLKKRFDFGMADPAGAPDLFSGSFVRAKKARPICRFEPDEFDVANAVKWAIESATKIPCLFRDAELLTEATPATVTRLKEIANHIAECFRALIKQFNGFERVNVSDRAVFVMGLYDGMMNERRSAGQRLPSGAAASKRSRKKKGEVNRAEGLHIHPYTIAVDLGKQIRFSAPVERITAELDAAVQRHLTEGQC